MGHLPIHVLAHSLAGAYVRPGRGPRLLLSHSEQAIFQGNFLSDCFLRALSEKAICSHVGGKCRPFFFSFFLIARSTCEGNAFRNKIHGYGGVSGKSETGQSSQKDNKVKAERLDGGFYCEHASLLCSKY